MRIAFIAVTALILLGRCAAAQEITNDYSKADFAHFKTYAWASGHPVPDELLNQSIVSSPADSGARTSGRPICPLPFWKPVSAASSFTLIVRHSSAALWTDQVEN